jgi:hypothetical protein
VKSHPRANQVSVSSFVRRLLWVGAFLVPLLCPRQSSADTLRLNITRIEQWDWNVDTGLFEGKDGDFFVFLDVGGSALNNRALGLSDGECFLNCPNIGPTRADPIVFDLAAVQANWSFTKELTSNDPFDIVIDLRDADAFNGTTQMDISPSDADVATIRVDPSTRTWSGDAVSPSNCVEAEIPNFGPAPLGRLCFDIVFEAPPVADDLAIRCLHDPLWPAPDATVSVDAELLNATTMTPLTADAIEVWVDGALDTSRAGVSTLRTAIGSFPRGSFAYGCFARRNGTTVFSGWRRAAIGLPEGGASEPVPILLNGPQRNHVDFTFVPDVDDYTGAADPAFQSEIRSLLLNGWFSRRLFLERQRDLNFWLAPDTGDAVNPDGAPATICTTTPPAGLDSRYLFSEALALIHRSDVCRDSAGSRLFSSEPTSFGTVVHESGHRPFGLADEYDGDGGYFETDTFPNVFRMQATCDADALTVAGALSPCRTITETRGTLTRSWFTSDPAAGDLMVDNQITRPLDERRILMLLDRCRTGSCDTGLSLGASPAPTNEPGSEVIPTLAQAHEDIVVMEVAFDTTGARVEQTRVLRASPATTFSNPPQLMAQLLDASGAELSSFYLWDPRQAFAYGPDGRHATVQAVAPRTAVYFPLAQNVHAVRLDDLVSGSTLMDVPLHNADLELRDAVLGATASQAQIGSELRLEARVTAGNGGPRGPVDAVITWSTEVPSAISPAAASSTPLSLAVGETRAVAAPLSVGCRLPGEHTIRMHARIAGASKTAIDVNPANDQVSANLAVSCWNGVEINLRPGLRIDVIPRWAPLEIAVLASSSGGAGDILAAWIDPASLRFGSRATLLAGGGAPPLHVQSRRSVARDGTRDALADVLGLFPTWTASLDHGLQEVCVAGSYTTSDGRPARFIGCDRAFML